MAYPKSPIGSSRPVKRAINELPFEQQERPSWGSMGNLPPLFGHPPASYDDPSPVFQTSDASAIASFSYLGIGVSNNIPSGGSSARESPRPPLSPTVSSRHSALPPNLMPSNSHAVEVDYAPRAGYAAGTGAVAGKGAMVGAPSSPAPMMKPAPLQRAGSAGGVLMHASRRPPPSPTTMITASPDPAHWGVPIPTASATSHPLHPGPNVHLGSAYLNDQEASEEWFDQFGGIEMEPGPNVLSSGLSNLSLNTTPYGPPYDLPGEPILERHTELPNPRMMNARYLPNQRANFALPHHQPYVGPEPQHPRVSSLTSVPTFMQHHMMAPLHVGSSPQSTSLASVLASPNTVLPPSYSVVKHSSRILMIHNFDQLNTDMNTLRSLCTSHGGVVRSVAPFPESNAILISFFDLRHAQKAMSNLNSKILPSGAMLEIQYHFLRDTGVMSKDANQGTLVIFNLDPVIANAELMELFGRHGEIKEIRESPNRKHKFVEFYDVRCAEKAIKALNKTDLHGRKIKIEPSRPGGTSKLEQPAGRRGSVGSVFGVPPSLYTSSASPSGAMVNNHAFTHSTPTLPTMSAASSGFRSATSSATSVYASFSPAAAPLLAVPNAMPYHTAHSPSSPSSPSSTSRYYDTSMTDDHHVMFSSQLGDHHPSYAALSLNPPMLSVGQSPSAMGNTVMVSARRQSASTPDIHSMTMVMMEDNFRFERSLLDPHMPMTPQTSYSDIDSVYSDTSSAASLFGASSRFNAQQHEGSVFPLDASTYPLSSHSDTLPGLLLSPITTPRSSAASSSSSSADSGVLEASALQLDEDASMPAPLSSGPTHPNGNVTESGSHQLKFDIVISQVLGGLDTRTTLMIKNIPNKYDQDMLLLAVNRRHQGTYDFFYLPIDFKNRCNVGYAFINFIDPKNIPAFCEEFDNKKWEKFNSEKVCRISYARIQGKLAMIEHFKNSSLMFEDPKCRPLIFHSDGSSVGKPEPFPVGPNVRPRTRKESAGSASGAGPTQTAATSSTSTSSTPAATASPTRAYKPKKDKLTGSPAPSRAHHD